MNSNITMPVTAPNVLAIMRESQTPNRLFNILCLPNGGLIIILELRAILAPVDGFSLEHVEIVLH